MSSYCSLIVFSDLSTALHHKAAAPQSPALPESTSLESKATQNLLGNDVTSVGTQTSISRYILPVLGSNVWQFVELVIFDQKIAENLFKIKIMYFIVYSL